MYKYFLTHSSVDGHLGLFFILATVNRGVKISLLQTDLNPSGSYLDCSSISSFCFCFVLFLRNLHTVFHSGTLVYIPSNSV